MLVALKPLHDAAGISRINVATYQSVSGAGKEAVDELAAQTGELLNGRPVEARVLAKQIAFNVLPQIDKFQDNGYTKEEMKMFWETQKIMGDKTILVNATAVRVPVFFGHSEAVHIETRRKLTAAEARALLEKAPGVTVMDERVAGGWPTAATEAANHDTVYVGRIRKISRMSVALTCGWSRTMSARVLPPTACRLPRYWFATICELSYIPVTCVNVKYRINIMFSNRIRCSRISLGLLMRLRLLNAAAVTLLAVPGISFGLGLGEIQLKSLFECAAQC